MGRGSNCRHGIANNRKCRPKSSCSQLVVLMKSRHQLSSEFFSVTVRYDTRCYFNVQSKADMSQFNLPDGTNN